MDELKENTITIDQAIIYYWIAGNKSANTLLFFHGWPGYLLLESGVIQELAKYFYVISVQHPGLGKSDPLSSYTNVFEQNADVAFEILKKENRDKEKVFVMGQSFGGGVASAFAYKYSKNTKALIVTDSLMGGENKLDIYSLQIYLWLYFGPFISKLIIYFPKFIQKYALWEGMGVRIKNSNDWERIYKSMHSRIELVENFAKVVRDSNKTKISILDKQYADFPILMLWGDRDGKEFSRYGSCNVDRAKELAEKMRQYNKKLKFVTVHGGHTILYRNPKYVVGEMIKNLPRFSRRLPDQGVSL